MINCFFKLETFANVFLMVITSHSTTWAFFDTSIFTTGGDEQLIIIIQITSNHALHSSSSVDQNNSIELYISTFGLK